MARAKKKELWMDVLDIFADRMREKGFVSWFIEDRTMPRMICDKKNHYRFEMIAFLYPEPVSVSLKASIGTDVHTVMYFKMGNISDNTWERFNAMMKAAEQYIDYELPDNKEDRREF